MNLYAVAFLFSTKFLPFLYAVIGFGLLITIHEFGHFLFCKLFGIHTPTFSIGMGPTIFQRKFGKTNFRLAVIPIGGYVEIAGMAEVGQGEQEHAKATGAESFSSKPYWQRFLVLMGGVLFNVLFAYTVFSTLYLVGMPVQKEVEVVVNKAGDVETNGSNQLRLGDKVLSVNEHVLSSDPKKLFPMLRTIATELGEQTKGDLVIQILRNGKESRIVVPVEKDGSNLQKGLLVGASLDVNPTRIEYEKYSFFKAIKKGVLKTNEWIEKTFLSLKMLVAKRNIKDFGGPIMIVSQSFKMAQQGFLLLFVFLAIISINLAVINVLPIGALDGGQLLFETIEAIIRRKIPEVIRFSVNLVSWVLILGLILFLSYQDILALFFNK